MKGDVELLLKGVGDQAVAKEVKHILEMVFIRPFFCLPLEVSLSLCFSLILLCGVGCRQDVRHQEEKFFTQIFSHHLLLRNQFQSWESLLMLQLLLREVTLR